MASCVTYAFLLIAYGIHGYSGFILDNIAAHIPHKVCYGELGCFSNGPPFLSTHRPLSVAPESPSAISTRFLLYTRQNPSQAEEQLLLEDDASSITSSNYNGSLPTKVIIHGFTHNAHRPWVQTMVQELLKNSDFNVIAVDWQHGAALPYEQATANTRVVGAQTAQMIKALMQATGQTADTFHIIGHSLGAHTAGYAGERIPGLGQITGLDPAGPYFESTDTSVRLDPSDASYVDVMHTDDGGLRNIGFGVTAPCGHIDFYPNGGSQQPGCSSDAVDKLGHTVWTALTSQLDYYASEETLACSHERSYQYYTESINHPNCRFASFPCANIDLFNKGHCLACPATGCPSMGFRSKESTATGSMYLDTFETSTFCAHTYVINITASNAFDGILSVKLTGTTGTSKVVQLMSANEPHKANSIISKMFMVHEDIGDIASVTLHYEKTNLLFISNAYPDDWQLVGIAILNADTQNRQTLCAYHKELDNHDSTTFKVTGSC